MPTRTALGCACDAPAALPGRVIGKPQLNGPSASVGSGLAAVADGGEETDGEGAVGVALGLTTAVVGVGVGLVPTPLFPGRLSQIAPAASAMMITAASVAAAAGNQRDEGSRGG